MVAKTKKPSRGIFVPFLIVTFIAILLFLITSPFYPWPKHLQPEIDSVNNNINLPKLGLKIYSDGAGSNTLFGGCMFEIDLAECPTISEVFFSAETPKDLIPILSSAIQKAGYYRSKQGNYYRNTVYECSYSSCTMFYHKYLLDLDVSIEALSPPYSNKSRIYLNIGGTGPPTREIYLLIKSLTNDRL